MNVLIPCAGKGTRLRPHTHVKSKILIEVAGKTILDHLLGSLAGLEISRLGLIVNPWDTQIAEHVRDRYDIPFHCYTQDQPQGLAHAVAVAGDELTDEPVLIILGDTLVDADVTALCGQGHSVLGVKEVADPRRFGVAVLDDTGRVVKLEEKNPEPRSNLALVGLYYIENGNALKQAIETLMSGKTRTRGEYQITDALQLMVAGGEEFTTAAIDGWYDCGTIDALLETHHWLLKSAPQAASGGTCVVEGRVYIDPGATVDRAVLGPGVSIGRGATVRDAVIRNSIIGNNATVEVCLLDQSIIGDNAQVTGDYRSINIADDSHVQSLHT